MSPDKLLERTTKLTMILVEKAHARANEQLEPGYERPARAPDAILAFTRLTRSLQQLCKANPQPAAIKPGRAQAAPKADDPRRDLVLPDLVRTVRKHPEKRRLERELARVLEEVLAANPDMKPLEVYDATCHQAGVTSDHAQVSDQTLGMPPRIYPPRDEIPPLDPDRFTVIPWPDRKD